MPSSASAGTGGAAGRGSRQDHVAHGGDGCCRRGWPRRPRRPGCRRRPRRPTTQERPPVRAARLRVAGRRGPRPGAGAGPAAGARSRASRISHHSGDARRPRPRGRRAATTAGRRPAASWPRRRRPRRRPPPRRAPRRATGLEPAGRRRERRCTTRPMPTSSAILSAVPKSAIAVSFAQDGARSMSAPPITTNGPPPGAHGAAMRSASPAPSATEATPAAPATATGCRARATARAHSARAWRARTGSVARGARRSGNTPATRPD